MEKDRPTGRFVPDKGRSKPDKVTKNVEKKHGVKDHGGKKEKTVIDLGLKGAVGVKGGLSSLLRRR